MGAVSGIEGLGIGGASEGLAAVDTREEVEGRDLGRGSVARGSFAH